MAAGESLPPVEPNKETQSKKVRKWEMYMGGVGVGSGEEEEEEEGVK